LNLLVGIKFLNLFLYTSKIKTEIFSGLNKVLLVLGWRTCAYREDYAMMMECSDLTAPNKAKTFQKHSLKQLHPSYHTVKQHESNQARQWKQMNLDDLGDICNFSAI
jgi:hypothetical protein